MSLLTTTDCADADNRVQARYELDAAERTGSADKFTQWAMKWGRVLLDYADAAPTDDETDDAVSAAVSRVENDYADAIRHAIKSLDAIQFDAQTQPSIDAIADILENSL